MVLPGIRRSSSFKGRHLAAACSLSFTLSLCPFLPAVIASSLISHFAQQLLFTWIYIPLTSALRGGGGRLTVTLRKALFTRVGAQSTGAVAERLEALICGDNTELHVVPAVASVREVFVFIPSLHGAVFFFYVPLSLEVFVHILMERREDNKRMRKSTMCLHSEYSEEKDMEWNNAVRSRRNLQCVLVKAARLIQTSLLHFYLGHRLHQDKCFYAPPSPKNLKSPKNAALSLLSPSANGNAVLRPCDEE